MSVDHDRRVIVYPNYINSKRTVAQGRRIPAPSACEDPNVVEILDCLKYLKLPAEIEDKSYPRDWMVRGRVRVQLLDDDGKPINPEIPTRREMLLRIAALVPKHPGRHKKPGQQKAGEAAAGAAAAAGSSSSAGSKQASSKKGKKKK